MTVLDHTLAAALIVLSLAMSAARLPEHLGSAGRSHFYLQGTFTAAVLAGTVLLCWQLADRGFDRIGLFSWWGRGAGMVVPLALLWAAMMALAYRLLQRGSWPRRLLPVYRRFAFIMPETPRELWASWSTSVAAGAGEEIAYRGFLLWYLASFAGIPAALFASSVIFGAAHGYQRASGMAYAAIAGLSLAGAALASGSLLLIMWMHATYNIASFTLGRRILERRDEAGA